MPYDLNFSIKPLKFNSESLNQVDNHKHLGVTISSNGKWAEHINNICLKATKQIFTRKSKVATINTSKQILSCYWHIFRVRRTQEIMTLISTSTTLDKDE
jgi:hypothetical protein